ncbi:NACHT domain-containing protein [Archangium gephyra]|uniref:NACHT domain-containing protein n=1 Tax=Archangium gephyra TaxID=48 RepID=UPI0035D3E217
MELIKKIIDVISSGDWLRIWQWISSIRNWNGVEGWIAGIIGSVAALYFLFILFKKLLDAYIGLTDTWKKAGLPVQLSAAQRDALRRRQQFCRMLRSDLDALNKAENWNDQSFTDLEAEVEVDGSFYVSRIDRLFGRKSRGLRRLPSLIRAIESSSEQWLLLVGEPGSGKSVALRHLAYQLADSGARSSDPGVKIPLYINLKELPPQPPQGPNADWIRSFVLDNIRRNDADTAAYVKEHWEAYLRKGTWFFLFDSFDEIPAVMHAPTGSNAIKEYAEAIRRFLAGMNDCRGIIASREFKGPDSLPWHKLRILTLSGERRERLVNNTFLSPEQKEIVRRYLATNDSLLQTPLFLTLLCRYVKEENRPPPHDHDLLIRHIDRLARRDPDYVKKTHRFTPEEILEGATKLAVLFASNPSLSLSPTHDQISSALLSGRFSGERLNQLLAALVDVKIGRSDVRTASIGDRRFSFAHRRYQEALFVRHLATHPHEISARALLMDLQWREYTVALLQTESSEVIAPLLAEATRLLDELSVGQSISTLPGFGEGLGYYQWGNEIHLLELLQEGFARRPEDVPSTLTAQVGRLLSLRWEKGDFDDRTRVVRLGGLLPQEDLAKYLKFAVEKGTDPLQELAFRRMEFLQEPPPDLKSRFRSRLAVQTLFASTRTELLRIEALAARLPTSINAKSVFQKFLFVRRALAPIMAIARGWAKHIPLKDLKFITTSDSSEKYRNVILFSLLNLSNAAGIALAISAFPLDRQYWTTAVGLVLPGLVIFSLSIVVLKQTFTDPDWPLRLRVFVYTIFSLIWAVMISPYICIFRGLITRNWTLIWIGVGIFALLHVLLYLTDIPALLARRRQRTKLNALRSNEMPAMPLPLQAESLSELDTWMRAQKDVLVPDVAHRRSLSRLILYGLEASKDTPVQEPPLLVYCIKNWPTDDSRNVFSQLQEEAAEVNA